MRLGIALTIGLAGACWAQTDDSFQRAAALYRSGDCHAAIPLLERSGGTNPHANLLLGRCYFETQQWARAVEAFATYQKSAPADPEAVILVARAQEREGHGDAAAAILNDFLKLHPEQQSVRTALGDLDVRLGRGSDAMTEHQAVLREQPTDPGSRIGVGLLLLHEEKWQAAIDQLEKIRPDVPEDSRVLSGIGTAYSALGNCERAIDPLRLALDLSPDDYALAKKVASCDVKLKRWSAVLGALRTGTIEESRDEEATRMVVEAYSASADVAGAEAYCRWAIIATPANLTAHLSLANLLYTGKRMREAYSEYAEVVKLKPDSPDIHERMGDISMDQKDPSDARAHYEAAVQSLKASDTVRMKLARLCFASDDYKCVTQTVAAVKSPALIIQAKTLRARVEYKSENWDQAGILANELLASDPQNSTLLQIAADVAARQNKPVEAADLYERALKLEPANKDFVYRLAGLYSNYDELKDRLPRAIALLTDFLQKVQQDAEGYLLLGNVYRKTTDLENAKLNFKTGFDKIQPPIPPRLSWAYNAYGVLLYNENKFEEAYPYETQAVQLNPNDEASQLNLALLCLELGKMDELNAARDKLVAMKSTQVAALDQEIDRKKGAAKKRQP
ncbi:MAG TPA: tetratricopeptide repeat protein [Bryobacteraceae bacterium]|nr:tetratricopeptide repeat protein [Bryobacteraceae bacterium]